MVIFRRYPGDLAPWQGHYALVGHYGESTGLIVYCEAGQQLPSVVNVPDADLGPFWFVYVDITHVRSAAA
jgi:hypothetical protein